MSTSDSGRISVFCTCGAKLKVAQEHLGRKGKCPKCANVFVLEVHEERETGTLELAPEEFGGDLLSEMVEAAERAPVTPSPQTGVTCINCGDKHPSDARICTHCGFDSVKGRVVKGAAPRTQPQGFLVSIARRLGAFGFGCALSTGGALIGAGIWFAVAIITDYEIGYIAWALGLLAGGGMALGYRDRNVRAGATAAVISAGGIVAAKLAIFLYVNAADISAIRADIAGIGSESRTKYVYVVAHRVEQEALRNQWSWDSRHRQTAYEAHSEAVASLSDEELDAEAAAIKTFNDGGKWDEANYPTNLLLMHYAQQSCEATLTKRGADPDDEDGGPTEREWARCVDDARGRISSQSSEDRLAEAKRVSDEQDFAITSSALAYQVVQRRSVREGISPYDYDHAEALRAEVSAQHASIPLEDLKRTLQEREQREKTGSDDDAEYMRARLIYDKASDVAQTAYEEHYDRDDHEWELPNEQWQTYFVAATEEVAHLDDRGVAEELKRREADDEAQRRESLERWQQQVTNETAKDAMSFFVENYFGGMDLVFTFFALATAWGIASGGTAE